MSWRFYRKREQKMKGCRLISVHQFLLPCGKHRDKIRVFSKQTLVSSCFCLICSGFSYEWQTSLHRHAFQLIIFLISGILLSHTQSHPLSCLSDCPQYSLDNALIRTMDLKECHHVLWNHFLHFLLFPLRGHLVFMIKCSVSYLTTKQKRFFPCMNATHA